MFMIRHQILSLAEPSSHYRLTLLKNSTAFRHCFSSFTHRIAAPTVRACQRVAISQTRFIRRPGHPSTAEEKSDDQHKKKSEQTSSDKFSEAFENFGPFNSTDPEAIRREFDNAFRRFFNYRMFTSREKVKGSTDERTKFNEELEQKMKEFIDEFNKRLNEHEVVQISKQQRRNLAIAWLIGASLMVVVVVSGIFSLTGGRVLSEHEPVLAQPAISYEQFVQDYLAAGEVQMIFYYPARSKAVALLHPGAIIHGQPFHGAGVHIQLNPTDSFFPVRLEAEQKRLGIDPRDHVPIAVKTPSMFGLSLFLIGWVILFMLFIKFGRIAVQRALFKIVKKEDKKKSQ